MTIEEIEVATPPEREVLVELKAPGLCHPDLHGTDGCRDFASGFPGLYSHEVVSFAKQVLRQVSEAG